MPAAICSKAGNAGFCWFYNGFQWFYLYYYLFNWHFSGRTGRPRFPEAPLEKHNVFQWFSKVPLADPRFRPQERIANRSAAIWWKAENVGFSNGFQWFYYIITFFIRAFPGQTVKSLRFPMVLRDSAPAHWAMWNRWKALLQHKPFRANTFSKRCICPVTQGSGVWGSSTPSPPSTKGSRAAPPPGEG